MRSPIIFVLVITAMSVSAGCVGPTVATAPTGAPTAPETQPASPTAVPTSSPTGLATEGPTPAATSEPTAVPSLECAVLPQGGFLAIWQSDAQLQNNLGCPTSNHPRITPEAWMVSTAYQPFERGLMIWSNQIGWFPQPVIYVAYDDGTYERFDDAFDPAVDPTGGGETPPDGLVEPVLGLGKFWREPTGVRDRVGWATDPEAPGTGRFQLFTGGDMLWISQTDKTYAFVFSTGTAYVFDMAF